MSAAAGVLAILGQSRLPRRNHDDENSKKRMVSSPEKSKGAST